MGGRGGDWQAKRRLQTGTTQRGPRNRNKPGKHAGGGTWSWDGPRGPV